MTVTLDIPPPLAEMLRADDPNEERALVVEAVCSLYARDRLSSGEASRWLGLTRPEFWHELAKRRIPRPYTAEMLQEDLAFARSQR